MLREIEIDLPRPRPAESPAVRALARELKSTLALEVDRNTVLELAAIEGGAEAADDGEAPPLLH